MSLDSDMVLIGTDAAVTVASTAWVLAVVPILPLSRPTFTIVSPLCATSGGLELSTLYLAGPEPEPVARSVPVPASASDGWTSAWPRPLPPLLPALPPPPPPPPLSATMDARDSILDRLKAEMRRVVGDGG